MAIQRFKVSLNAARFPLVSTKGQRAVFIPGLDTAPRTPRTFMGSNESVDYNLSQIVYGENIMPVSEGLKSVGYSQLIAPTVNSDFDQIFALRDDAENTVLYSPAAGKNYIYDTGTSAWTTTTFNDIHGVNISVTSPNTEATAKVTYAYVDGKTFVCYSRLTATGTPDTDASILFWNPTTVALEPAGALIANLPFGVGEIDGISSSNGYLIIYSDISVAWAAFNGTAFDYDFNKAILSDVIRFLATDAGIRFISLPDDHPASQRLITFSIRSSPFEVLETICRANGVVLVLDQDVWHAQTSDDSALVEKNYALPKTSASTESILTDIRTLLKTPNSKSEGQSSGTKPDAKFNPAQNSVQVLATRLQHMWVEGYFKGLGGKR